MAWFGQSKDTIEWTESGNDLLFHKWPNSEIKRGSRLVIRSGQKAIFYAGGRIEGIFEMAGTFDIVTEIVPFLSTLGGWFELRGDTGLRTEVYFVNSKELFVQWGTRQRIMIPTPEVPSGVPIGMNGTLVVEFRDYLKFIDKVAGIKAAYSIDDVKERIMGELSPIVAEAVLHGDAQAGLSVLAGLQKNSRELGKTICMELDIELDDIGLGVREVNITAINYPDSVQAMFEKLAGQAAIGDMGKYVAVGMADGMEKGDTGVAALGAQVAVGAQIAGMMSGAIAPKEPQGDRFCPKCRKMTTGKYCSECGTETI